MTLRQFIILSVTIGAFTFGASQQPIYAAAGLGTAEPAQNLDRPASVTTQHHINVDGTVLEAKGDKPQIIYIQGQPLVALRQVSEALGYTVTWDNDTKTATIHMSVADLKVRPDVSTLERTGKLQNINLNGSETILPTPRFVDGMMYISPNAFKMLLNDVSIGKDEIYIVPQRSELQGENESRKGPNDLRTFLPPEKGNAIPYSKEDSAK